MSLYKSNESIEWKYWNQYEIYDESCVNKTRKLDDKKGEKSQDTAILSRELEGGFLN